MAEHRNDWRRTVILFAVTGLVESLAFGHLGAFTPLYLRQLNVADAQIPAWTGALSALGFVIGLPLLPFWAVWADRYGRKLIIVRSSVAGAALFALAAMSRDVWMLAGARFLVGFVLGNTGVMMAVQSEITPKGRLGAAVAVVSAGAPIGMAVGPLAGGYVARIFGIRTLLGIDAALTALVAVALILWLREEPRRTTRPSSTWTGLLAAWRGISGAGAVMRLFAISFLLALGGSICVPYLPLLVERLARAVPLEPAIGQVISAGGVALALCTPFVGAIGDRLGHIRLLRLGGIGVSASLGVHALAASLGVLAAARACSGIFQAAISAPITVLLATLAPPESRATVLTLSLLPQQLAWFLGPLVGTLAASSLGLRAPFVIASVTMLAGVALSVRGLTQEQGA